MNQRQKASAERIEDLLQELGPMMFMEDEEIQSEDMIMTGWIVTSEWRTSTDRTWIVHGIANGMSPIHAIGLTHETLTSISARCNCEHNYGDDPDADA